MGDNNFATVCECQSYDQMQIMIMMMMAIIEVLFLPLLDDNNDGFDGSNDNFGGPENQVPSPLFSVTFNSRPFVA